MGKHSPRDITSSGCLSKFQPTMTKGSLLVRLVSSDLIIIESGLPCLRSVFLHQLAAGLPSHEVRSNIVNKYLSMHSKSHVMIVAQVASISVPASASTVVEMLKGKKGEKEEELR